LGIRNPPFSPCILYSIVTAIISKRNNIITCCAYRWSCSSYCGCNSYLYRMKYMTSCWNTSKNLLFDVLTVPIVPISTKQEKMNLMLFYVLLFLCPF
jgi:hypothetical protein